MGRTAVRPYECEGICNMKYDPNRHRRRSVRLQGYDYTQNGAYFVTICVHNRACLFGDIGDDGLMQLSACGEIVHEEWV